jgi:hypothetical protein
MTIARVSAEDRCWTGLGHSTIAMTLDTYGHFFASENDEDELAAAEQRLFGTAVSAPGWGG